MARAGEAGWRPHAAVGFWLVPVVLALSACDGATPREASRAGAGLELAAPVNPRAVERDIPAPEVFEVTESGLWDGRPSLGGVWVAHPTVRDPERALIRNSQTGEEVIGALFRRERENPGPRFQISSEAATALGILAGQPTTITVTALRLQRIETPRTAEPAAEPADTAAVVPAAAAPDTAALAVVPGAVPAAAPDAVVEIAAVDPEPAAPRRGLRDLFRRQPAETGVPAADASIALTPLPPVEPVAAPAPAAAPIMEAAPLVAAAPLADTALAAPAEALATVEPAAAERRGLRDLFRREPRPASVPIPEPTAEDLRLIPLPAEPVAAAAPRAGAAMAGRPFVQIGIFSVEANATRAQAQMRASGLPAEIRRGRAGERDFWRVVVGPAADPAAQAEHLRRVRTMGFADAYAVAR